MDMKLSFVARPCKLKDFGMRRYADPSRCTTIRATISSQERPDGTPSYSTGAASSNEIQLTFAMLPETRSPTHGLKSSTRAGCTAFY
jgi:hypothetical protein